MRAAPAMRAQARVAQVVERGMALAAQTSQALDAEHARSGAKVVLIGRAGQDLGKFTACAIRTGLGLQNARRPVARDAQAQRLRHGPGP